MKLTEKLKPDRMQSSDTFNSTKKDELLNPLD